MALIATLIGGVAGTLLVFALATTLLPFAHFGHGG